MMPELYFSSHPFSKFAITIRSDPLFYEEDIMKLFNNAISPNILSYLQCNSELMQEFQLNPAVRVRSEVIADTDIVSLNGQTKIN